MVSQLLKLSENLDPGNTDYMPPAVGTQGSQGLDAQDDDMRQLSDDEKYFQTLESLQEQQRARVNPNSAKESIPRVVAMPYSLDCFVLLLTRYGG